MASQLRPDKLGNCWVHICVDMQVMFRAETAWAFSWPEQLVPNIVSLCRTAGERNIFTRFLPALTANEGHGTWYQLYQRWPQMLVSEIGYDKVQLIEELVKFCAPERDIAKRTYSPWGDSRLTSYLTQLECETVVVSGIETDLCVLATLLGAVDKGYRTILVYDSVASSVAVGHEAVLQLLQTRLGTQLEFTATQEFVQRVSQESS